MVEKIAIYGFYALIISPAIGLALYALYLAIEDGGEEE